jgi:hypothetical protein
MGAPPLNDAGPIYQGQRRDLSEVGEEIPHPIAKYSGHHHHKHDEKEIQYKFFHAFALSGYVNMLHHLRSIFYISTLQS